MEKVNYQNLVWNKCHECPQHIKRYMENRSIAIIESLYELTEIVQMWLSEPLI